MDIQIEYRLYFKQIISVGFSSIEKYVLKNIMNNRFYLYYFSYFYELDHFRMSYIIAIWSAIC